MPKTGLRIEFPSVTFDDADIRDAKIVEQIDPICVTLPKSTFEVTLYSNDSDFSPINPAGVYADFQYHDPMYVYATISGRPDVFLGKFYLERWENLSENLIKFYCTDEIGILDDLPFMGGIYSGINIETLLVQLFSGTGIAFVLDESLKSVTLSGWLPISSVREALQQILFAGGGYAKTTRQPGFISISVYGGNNVTLGARCGVPAPNQSRNWSIRWRPAQWDFVRPTLTITDDMQSLDQRITLKPQITEVHVTGHNYAESSTDIELFNAVMESGYHTITFSEPVHTLGITGGTINSSGANYALIYTSGATVVITGKKYNHTTRVFKKVDTTIPTGTKDNIIQIKEATLVSLTDGEDTAQRVFDYYAKRKKMELNLYVPENQPGDPIIIDTLYNQQIEGQIEQMNIDLTGGFVVETTIVGDLVTT